MSDNKILVDVNNLKKHFSKGKDIWGRNTSVLKAVDGVSFQIRQGRPLDWSESRGAASPRLDAACCDCMTIQMVKCLLTGSR